MAVNWTLQAEDLAFNRLDKLLAARLPELSRSRLQDLMRGGHIRLNGQAVKASAQVRVGDLLEVEIPAPQPVEVVAQDIALDVLFEDRDILILNKPTGLVVHPAAGNPDGTLVNALLHHCDDLSGVGGELRPGIVHRLDKDTSGVMVVAKSDNAHRRLSEAFAQRSLSKIYLAAISGQPKTREGRLENHITRHPVDRKRMCVSLDGSGKNAVTEWQQVALHQGCALIRCRLLTGRTHQIRVHMRECLGHPILGDPIYGNPKRDPISTGRLMLHAWKLALEHPISGQPLRFEAPIPAEFHPWTATLEAGA